METKIENIDELVKSIPQWNPKIALGEMLKKNNSFTMIIAGSRAAGKSELLKYLLVNPECNMLKQFNTVVIFSKTLMNGFYDSFIPSKLKFGEFRNDVLLKLREVYAEFKEQGKKFRYLVILDDIIDNRIKYIDGIGDLFYCGRHYGASTIFLTQKLSCVSTGWIANTNFFVNLFTGSRKEKDFINERIIVDSIYERYPTGKKSEIEHRGFFLITKICQNYESLVVEPYNFNQKLYRFKAKLTKKKISKTDNFSIDL